MIGHRITSSKEIIDHVTKMENWIEVAIKNREYVRHVSHGGRHSSEPGVVVGKKTCRNSVVICKDDDDHNQRR